jgi:pimeloyl-ACP methyl ester carboxylesterase
MLNQKLPTVDQLHLSALSLVAVAAAMLTACQPEVQDSASSTVVPQSASDACAALAGMMIDSSLIGLPSTGAIVNSAELVRAEADNNSNGEFCKILGAIYPVDYTAPEINFEVNLPSQWNGKTLQFGGGGLNGVLINGLGHYAKQPNSEMTPLARGYVTLGSDSGHQGEFGWDPSFYLNEESLLNYGHQQIKKTHDVAMQIVQVRYGQESSRNYFIGGSQGGHEGFDAAQRFPNDYDGVVAGYPAHNVVMLHLSALNYARALDPDHGDGWMNPAEIGWYTDQVYARCDDLDGAKDGIISNRVACQGVNAELKLKNQDNPLRCTLGLNTGDDCLSDAQIAALNTMDTPYRLSFNVFNDDEGGAVFPKWTPFEGSTFMDGGASNLGVNGPEQALQRTPGIATPGYAIAQNKALDVIDDFDADAYAAAIIKRASQLSANSTNLDAFRNKGGKLIFFHGNIDDYIPVYSSIEYFNRLLGRYGSDLSNFVRFYTVPGMGHVTGVFNARISMLDALEAWVEEGQPPKELIAVDANEATAGRTRPVCEYPQWPQYNGSGDINSATSFTCIE